MQLANDTTELNKLYEDYWEFTLKESPTTATYLGDHRYDDTLEDYSIQAYHRRVDQYRKYCERLKSFRKPSNLSDRLNYDLFQRELEDLIEESKFQPHLLPINQQNGAHIDLPQLITYHPFKTRDDYGHYISRLLQFPRIFRQIIEDMRSGIKEKIVPARIVVEKIIPQLEVQIVEEPAESVLHKPVADIPPSIPKEDLPLLEEQVDEAVLGSVVPPIRDSSLS